MNITETGVYKVTEDIRIRDSAISCATLPKGTEFLVSQISAENRQFYSPMTGWQHQTFPARRLGPVPA